MPKCCAWSEGKDAITLKSDDGNSGLFGGTPGVASVDTGRGELATAPDGSLWIAYSGPHRERDVSASALIDKTLAPGSLARCHRLYRRAGRSGGHADGAASRRRKCMPKPPRIFCWTRRCAGRLRRRRRSCCAWRCSGSAASSSSRGSACAGPGCSCCASSPGSSTVSWRLYANQHVLFDALGPSLALAAVWLAGASVRGFEIARMRNRLKLAFADVAAGAHHRADRAQSPAHEARRRKPHRDLPGLRRARVCRACRRRSAAIRPPSRG